MMVEPDGDVQLCCATNLKHEFHMSMGNLNHDDPLDIWNNAEYRNVRKRMLDGKPSPRHCKDCYQREAGKLSQSERQRYNSEFPVGYEIASNTSDDGSVPELDIRYLDIRFNNLCNLMCRTCGPDWSTSWAAERGIDKPLRYNDTWRKLIPYTKNLQKVYFAGGEPLMTPEHYDFLEQLLEVNPNVELLYTSNFTRLELKGKHVLDYWPKFGVVNAIASIDHYGEHAKYVRTNSDYDVVTGNLNTIRKAGYPNVRPGVTSVYSLYNATRFGDFIINMFEDGTLESMNQLTVQLLVNPDYQMATIMPDSALSIAVSNTESSIEYLEERGENPEKLVNALTWLVNNHKYDAEKFGKFCDYNRSLDKLRHTDFNNMYKEYNV